MIDFGRSKKYRQAVLDLLVKKVIRNYHEDMFNSDIKDWFYRDSGDWRYPGYRKVSMFEAVIYHEADEEGFDITYDEVQTVKTIVKEKTSL